MPRSVLCNFHKFTNRDRTAPPRQPFQPMQGHCSLFWDLLVIVSDHHLAGLVDVAAAQRDDQIPSRAFCFTQSAAASRLSTSTEPGI